MDTKMIGNKIAKARKDLNISQAQLAERLFISPQAVGKWERGESIPDLITLGKLAAIFNVDLNYFSDTWSSTTPEKAAIASWSEEPAQFPAPMPATKQESKRSWDMSGFKLVDGDFSGLKDLHEKFSSSYLQRCKFIGSDMPGLLLKGNHVESCDFSGSDISSSQFKDCHLSNDDFKDCSLVKAEFAGSHIKACNFSEANLTGAIFKSCAFDKNTLINAILERTVFEGTHLTDVVIEGVVENCHFENNSFSRVTFQNAKLINTFFKNGNMKRVQFINCAADRMTIEFLKNAKADVSGITVMVA